MKLKYYMRGLGIGILLATIILTIANRSLSPSDEEVIDKAIDLGMVFVQEEKADNIEKILDNLDPILEPNRAVEDEEAESIDDIETVDDIETIDDIETVDDIETIDDIEVADDVESKDDVELTDKYMNSNITFTILKGMTSITVSEVLKEVGLIQDPEDFNKFIIDQGKAGVIRIGTYTLSENATYQQIVDAIT